MAENVTLRRKTLTLITTSWLFEACCHSWFLVSDIFLEVFCHSEPNILVCSYWTYMYSWRPKHVHGQQEISVSQNPSKGNWRVWLSLMFSRLSALQPIRIIVSWNMLVRFCVLVETVLLIVLVCGNVSPHIWINYSIIRLKHCQHDQ